MIVGAFHIIFTAITSYIPMKHNVSHTSSSAEIFCWVTSQCSGERAILAGHARLTHGKSILTQGNHWTCRLRAAQCSSAEGSKDVLRLSGGEAAILGGLHAVEGVLTAAEGKL